MYGDFTICNVREWFFLAWIFSWINSACASFVENISLAHEIFHESSIVVIAQSFVAIATRKRFSILWSISWIYTTCNCPSLLLQLLQENIFLFHDFFHEFTLLAIVQTFFTILTIKKSSCLNCFKNLR